MSESEPKHAKCSICSSLRDEEYAFQKHGREDEDTHLPAVVCKLTKIMELRPGKRPTEHLEQCPECKTYYLYKYEYEYLVCGSEDTEWLSRLSLTEDDAAVLLAIALKRKRYGER